MNPPTVLLVTANRWFASARIAMTLAQSGCRVTACCLPGHPFEKTGVMARRFRFNALHPARSVLRAMQEEMPALVLACDDQSTGILHRLYAEAAKKEWREGTELLERSLGAPESFEAAGSRSGVLLAAASLGIRIPLGQNLDSFAALEKWLGENGYPAYVKSDGTSGGVGVRRVDTLREARAAYRKLHAPPLLARVVKRALVNRNAVLVLPFLLRTRPKMSVQGAISGREATTAIACWKGKVLSALSMEVLQRTRPTGPASVLRMVENEYMECAAAKLVRHFGLSGLVGMDFMIEQATGQSYLLELNLRATQTAHLCMGPGHAPAYALGAKLRGLGTEALPLQPRREIALFPQEWTRDPESPYLASAFHDIPMRAPELVRAALGRRSKEMPLSGLEDGDAEMQKATPHAR